MINEQEWRDGDDMEENISCYWHLHVMTGETRVTSVGTPGFSTKNTEIPSTTNFTVICDKYIITEIPSEMWSVISLQVLFSCKPITKPRSENVLLNGLHF